MITKNKVEVFFKVIIFDSPLWKTKCYAICIEFQQRGSPHVHSFIWIFNAPNFEKKAAYIVFIKKIINVQLADHLNDPEVFELVKNHQVYSHSRICWEYNKNECRISCGCYFTEKAIIVKPLDSKLRNE